MEKALELFEEVFDRGPNWRILAERLVGVGLLTVSDHDLSRILSQDRRTEQSG
jgi:hypothetical protein